MPGLFIWQMKFDEQIKRITDKVHILLNQVLSLKKENEKLKQDLKQFKQKDTEKNTQIESLLQKVDILKAAKTELTEEEKKAFEKRINHYLREVEKCITLIQE